MLVVLMALCYVGPPWTSPLMPSTLRISNKLFLLSQRHPNLHAVRNTRKSSRVVSEARSAAFSPPSSDILFDLSPVPPNPLGEGRCIKTAGALVIGYVVCGPFRSFTRGEFAKLVSLLLPLETRF